MSENAETYGEKLPLHYSAASENVKLIGRYCIKNNVTWLVQSGSAVEFNICGSFAEVTFNEDDSPVAEKPRFAVFVDDKQIYDGLMNEKEIKIRLFSEKSAQNATAKIILLSEGIIGIGDISVVSDKKIPVHPTAEKPLKIEFIGDSITCAYGVEAESALVPFSTSCENFMMSYAYLTAQLLDADYTTFCYSGYGIISGYSTGQKVTDSLIPDYYPFASKNKNYAQKWDFKDKPNDVVVINLGTNDSSYLKYNFDEYSTEFTEKYEAFLNVVRCMNPDAYIICTVGTMGGKEVYNLIEKAIENFTVRKNDKKISCYLSAEQKSCDGYGSDWHPSAVTQKKSASLLAEKIRKIIKGHL